jgi:hypothetical protein
MMIKGRYTPFTGWLFEKYALWHMRKIFQSIRYVISEKTGENPFLSDIQRPVLLISNHFSFWDGFIHIMLNRRIFKRRVNIMMLHEQLTKRKFLRYTGAFSLDKGNRGVIAGIRHSVDLLKDKNNLFLIFPQGEIQSLYTRNFVFERGLEFIVNNSPGIQIIFNVNLMNFFSDRKPSLTMYLKEYTPQTSETIANLQQEFNLFALESFNSENPRERGRKII